MSTVHCSTTLALTDEDQHCSRQQKPHGEAGGLLLCRRRLLCSSSRWSTNLRRLRRLCHVCREIGRVFGKEFYNATLAQHWARDWLALRKRILPRGAGAVKPITHLLLSLGFSVLCYFLGTGLARAHTHTHTGTITQVHPRKEFNRKEKCAHTTGKETEATTGWANSRGTNEGRDGGSSGK